ncbi:MAG: glutathione S-transferase N-terminal domain-containing protein [Proteobacteria bacterium]|nr:glutathione S-transferase N-terminal domain-containing protein [Pseudomonadota bacterium]
MKLYAKPGACSLADHITLEWTGKPYEVQLITAAESRQPEYLKINPSGAVPALVDGDFTLTQNSAILNYIADMHPESGLGGDGSAKSRAEINRWLAFANSDIHPSYWPLFGATAFLGDEAAIEQTKAAARQKLRGLYERADAHLAGREWLADSRSIADPYLYVTMRWAGKVGVDLSGLNHLAVFRARMEADPGVQRALKVEGEAH